MSLHFFLPSFIEHLIYVSLLIVLWVFFLIGIHTGPPRTGIPPIIIACTTIGKISAVLASLIESRYLKKKTLGEQFRARTISTYTSLWLLILVTAFISQYYWHHWGILFQRATPFSKAGWVMANVSDIVILVISLGFLIYIYRIEFSPSYSSLRRSSSAAVRLSAALPPKELTEEMLANAEARANPGAQNIQEGISEEEMKEIEEYFEVPSNECYICRKEIRRGVKVKRLPCNHRFHSVCITAWLRRYPVCPVCKNNVRDMLRTKRNVALRTR